MTQDSTGLTTAPISCHGLMLVLFLFTGRLPLAHSNLQISAASFAGVCVFYGVLRDIRLPIGEAMTIEVIPGHIQHQEHIYHCVKDLDTTFLVSDAKISSLDIYPNKVDLVVEEVEDSKILAASYRVADVHEKWTFLGIESLMDAIRNSARTTRRPFLSGLPAQVGPYG
jgi:hypothetical protein